MIIDWRKKVEKGKIIFNYSPISIELSKDEQKAY